MTSRCEAAPTVAAVLDIWAISSAEVLGGLVVGGVAEQDRVAQLLGRAHHITDLVGR